jgi:hypothetical protein
LAYSAAMHQGSSSRENGTGSELVEGL